MSPRSKIPQKTPAYLQERFAGVFYHNFPPTQSEHRDFSAPIKIAVSDARGGSSLRMAETCNLCIS